ncbi:MAG TPA: hypothetical protein VE621_23070 [Bryobacteraceae bacterium]|jgi:hypothetical protein|nr:hypothetical protein [Bryobacteraceae bacterium]
MKQIRIACIGGMLVGSALHAQTYLPRLELSPGFNLVRLSPGPDMERTALPGWNMSATIFPTSRLGFTAEIGGARSTRSISDALIPDSRVRLNQTTFLAGPAVRLFRRDRFNSTFRAMFGVARGRSEFPSDEVPAGIISGQGPSSVGIFGDETVFASAIGSMWDIKLTDTIAWRIAPSFLFTRFGGETQITQRFSTGIVLRFGRVSK